MDKLEENALWVRKMSSFILESSTVMKKWLVHYVFFNCKIRVKPRFLSPYGYPFASSGFLAHLKASAVHTLLQDKFKWLEKLSNSAVSYCPLAQGAVPVYVNSPTQLWVSSKQRCQRAVPSKCMGMKYVRGSPAGLSSSWEWVSLDPTTSNFSLSGAPWGTETFISRFSPSCTAWEANTAWRPETGSIKWTATLPEISDAVVLLDARIFSRCIPGPSSSWAALSSVRLCGTIPSFALDSASVTLPASTT